MFKQKIKYHQSACLYNISTCTYANQCRIEQAKNNLHTNKHVSVGFKLFQYKNGCVTCINTAVLNNKNHIMY